MILCTQHYMLYMWILLCANANEIIFVYLHTELLLSIVGK